MAMIHSGFGALALLGLAWLACERRDLIAWRTVGGGIAMALGLIASFTWLPGLSWLLERSNGILDALMAASTAGTSFVFGYIGGGALPFTPVSPGAGFVLATQALPLILLISALSAVLFHWGILTRVVQAFAWLLNRTLGIGGAVGVSAAANAFVGMIEGPLVIRPWLARMSRGELFIVMNCGMATIAGTVLVLYATLLKPIVPQALGHLLIASVVAIPVAIAVAALMVPSDQPADRSSLVMQREDASTIAALTRGTLDGLQLLLNIVAMLIVFIALVALVDQGLALVPPVAGTPVSIARIMGAVFAPLAWLVGIPWAEAGIAGQLLGKKAVLNEFIAFADMASLPPEALSARSRLLMTYALAGFANFGSVGIMLGGMTPLMPEERRAEVGRLAIRSLPAGLLTTCITAALVGLLTPS
jgi:CNT family concentrative nucleoside transporter